MSIIAFERSGCKAKKGWIGVDHWNFRVALLRLDML